MNIEELNTRIAEIDKTINNTTQNLYMLHGHKAEALFHLEEAKKADEKKDSEELDKVEEPTVQ